MYGMQAAPQPPPPPAAPTPLVARPPEDPMGLADVVASAVPGWYALFLCVTLPRYQCFCMFHSMFLAKARCCRMVCVTLCFVPCKDMFKLYAAGRVFVSQLTSKS